MYVGFVCEENKIKKNNTKQSNDTFISDNPSRKKIQKDKKNNIFSQALLSILPVISYIFHRAHNCFCVFVERYTSHT